MKKLLFLFVALLATGMAFAKADKQVVVFDVDLHCQGCVNKIMKNIPYEKGMIDLSCDLEKKQVTVTYDAKKTTVKELQVAFDKINKPARVNVEATKAAGGNVPAETDAQSGASTPSEHRH